MLFYVSAGEGYGIGRGCHLANGSLYARTSFLR